MWGIVGNLMKIAFFMWGIVGKIGENSIFHKYRKMIFSYFGLEINIIK